MVIEIDELLNEDDYGGALPTIGAAVEAIASRDPGYSLSLPARTVPNPFLPDQVVQFGDGRCPSRPCCWTSASFKKKNWFPGRKKLSDARSSVNSGIGPGACCQPDDSRRSTAQRLPAVRGLGQRICDPSSRVWSDSFGVQPVDHLREDLLFELRRYKDLADRAMAQLDDPRFFLRPAKQVNPVALIVKHIAGNLVSRWTDFFTTDGEKPSRDRDAEFFLTELDSRANLLESWERGWAALVATVEGMQDTDLERSVIIRGEEMSTRQALLRAMSHIAYHSGQILYLVRLLEPGSTWLTIPPGQSQGVPGGYRIDPHSAGRRPT